jgi:hypothetical protein
MTFSSPEVLSNEQCQVFYYSLLLNMLTDDPNARVQIARQALITFREEEYFWNAFLDASLQAKDVSSIHDCLTFSPDNQYYISRLVNHPNLSQLFTVVSEVKMSPVVVDTIARLIKERAETLDLVQLVSLPRYQEKTAGLFQNMKIETSDVYLPHEMLYKLYLSKGRLPEAALAMYTHAVQIRELIQSSSFA